MLKVDYFPDNLTFGQKFWSIWLPLTAFFGGVSTAAFGFIQGWSGVVFGLELTALMMTMFLLGSWLKKRGWFSHVAATLGMSAAYSAYWAWTEGIPASAEMALTSGYLLTITGGATLVVAVMRWKTGSGETFVVDEQEDSDDVNERSPPRAFFG